jgi:hypothetical protein
MCLLVFRVALLYRVDSVGGFLFLVLSNKRVHAALAAANRVAVSDIMFDCG